MARLQAAVMTRVKSPNGSTGRGTFWVSASVGLGLGLSLGWRFGTEVGSAGDGGGRAAAVIVASLIPAGATLMATQMLRFAPDRMLWHPPLALVIPLLFLELKHGSSGALLVATALWLVLLAACVFRRRALAAFFGGACGGWATAMAVVGLLSP